MVLPLVIIATVVGARAKAPQPGDRLLTELGTLVGDNQLFTRPGLSSDGGPSWYAGAYGLPVIAAATNQPPELGDASELARDLKGLSKGDPIWSRWYAVQVERATGTDIPGTWAEGILDAYKPSDNAAERIAVIAAVTDVMRAKSMTVPRAEHRALSKDLTSAVAVARSPYSLCRALQAASYLGLDTRTWTRTESEEGIPGRAFSAETVTNVYGALCVMELRGRPEQDSLKKQVLDWLKPHLTMEVAGSEFEAFFLAESWVKAGGARDDLAPLAAALRGRVDAGTGLLKQHVVRLGTLENTYYAAVLAERVGSFRQISGPRTVAAVRDQIPQARAHHSVAGLLMCAIILRYAGSADEALEDEAADLAVSWLEGGVDRDNVVIADQVVRQLHELGRDAPRIRAEEFPVRTAEDRYLAWTLLGMSDHLANGAALRKALAQQTADIEAAFDEPDSLMIKEVAAGLSAAGTQAERERLAAGLSEWSSSLRGCEGFQELYRPLKAESACSLEATVDQVTVVEPASR
ncbi:hypothetical protein ACWD25_24545 [Streptomyces sp. NPDC002920]